LRKVLKQTTCFLDVPCGEIFQEPVRKAPENWMANRIPMLIGPVFDAIPPARKPI
jgi:hypothetical protein